MNSSESVAQVESLTFRVDEAGSPLEAAGRLVVRYGLPLVPFWIGAMKFTAYEAERI